jgi:hypothetical protein
VTPDCACTAQEVHAAAAKIKIFFNELSPMVGVLMFLEAPWLTSPAGRRLR